MTVPRARLDPELRRFPLRRHRIHTAAGPLAFVAPESSQALLRRRGAGRREAWPDLPFWADLWPAGIAIARCLLRGTRLQGRHALDLGCGIGVAGTAAGVHGARVTFVDRCPDALPFARFNAVENGVVEHCVRVGDWSAAPPTDVDLLLMADLLYEYRHTAPLLRQVDAVTGGGGSVLCADPFRATADDFGAALRARGAVATELSVSHRGERVPVRLWWLGPGGDYDPGAHPALERPWT